MPALAGRAPPESRVRRPEGPPERPAFPIRWPPPPRRAPVRPRRIGAHRRGCPEKQKTGSPHPRASNRNPVRGYRRGQAPARLAASTERPRVSRLVSSGKLYANALSLAHRRTRRRILDAGNAAPIRHHRQAFGSRFRQDGAHGHAAEIWNRGTGRLAGLLVIVAVLQNVRLAPPDVRSEERRVGTEWRSTWSP